MAKRDAPSSAVANLIDALPHHMSTLIISFAAPRDIPSISSTCTSFAEHASEESLWEPLALKAYPHIGAINAQLRCPVSFKALYRQQLATCAPRQRGHSITDYALSFHFGERGRREKGKSAMHLFVDDVIDDVCTDLDCKPRDAYIDCQIYGKNKASIVPRLQQRWSDLGAAAAVQYDAAMVEDKAARHFEPTKRAPSVTDYSTIEHVDRVTFALNVPGQDMHAFGTSAMSSPLLVIDVHSKETGDMCKLILKEYDASSDSWGIGPPASPAECTDALESKNFFEQVQEPDYSHCDGHYQGVTRSSDSIFAHLELKKDGQGQFTSCTVEICALNMAHQDEQQAEIHSLRPFEFIMRLVHELPQTSTSGLCTSVSAAGFDGVHRAGQHAVWDETPYIECRDVAQLTTDDATFAMHAIIACDVGQRAAQM